MNLQLPQGHYLIIGQGGIGLAVTNRLAENACQVTGLARHRRDDYDLHKDADYIQADALTLDASMLSNFSHIAVIVTPDRYDANAYRDTYLAIAEHLASMSAVLPNLKRVVFMSSTGVYGQDDGEWIDVLTEPKLSSRAGSVYILQAEKVLQQAFLDKVVIIRASGIYGDTRRRLIEQAKQPLNKIDHHADMTRWTNRIMDSDLVTAVIHVLTMYNPEPMYLASDYSPVIKAELMAWLRQRMAKIPSYSREMSQIKTDILSAEFTSMTGKRIHSNIPRDWLQYPDWRSGYGFLLE